MADLTIWISGADFIKMGEFFALEGSNFLQLLVICTPNMAKITPNIAKKTSDMAKNTSDMTVFQQAKGCPTSPCTNARQKCQGDPWHRMSTAGIKFVGGGRRPSAGRPPQFVFCRGHPLPFPLHFCLHFIRRSMENDF